TPWDAVETGAQVLLETLLLLDEAPGMNRRLPLAYTTRLDGAPGRPHRRRECRRHGSVGARCARVAWREGGLDADPSVYLPHTASCRSTDRPRGAVRSDAWGDPRRCPAGRLGGHSG